MIVKLFLRLDRKPYDILRAAGCSSTSSTSYVRSPERSRFFTDTPPWFKGVSARPGCHYYSPNCRERLSEKGLECV